MNETNHQIDQMASYYTSAVEEEKSFVVTKEYKRFAEFCDACQREKYIGLCYGAPGVGKTLSARYYSKWFLLENKIKKGQGEAPLHPQIQFCRTILYTAEVSANLRGINQKILLMRVRLDRYIDDFIPEDEQQQHDPYDPFNLKFYSNLIIVDEAERLSIRAIDLFREIYDKGEIGLIFIGMSGLEKKLSRYPQLYSRVGFAHHYKSLSQDEMRFMLEKNWEQLGLNFNPNDFTDTEAISSITRITNGNFRLLNRLFRQIQRIVKINDLNSITAEVVEAARECLVIGTL